jgi:hypothetical protein
MTFHGYFKGEIINNWNMKPFESQRNFSAGSWDLRKVERRQVQCEIDFPNRRGAQRRSQFIEVELMLEPDPEIVVDKPR